MAAKTATKALRSSLSQQLAAPTVQRRAISSALRAASRPVVANASKTFAPAKAQQTRGLKEMSFAGVKETVYGKLEAVLLFIKQYSLTDDSCRARRLATRQASRPSIPWLDGKLPD